MDSDRTSLQTDAAHAWVVLVARVSYAGSASDRAGIPCVQAAQLHPPAKSFARYIRLFARRGSQNSATGSETHPSVTRLARLRMSFLVGTREKRCSFVNLCGIDHSR